MLLTANPKHEEMLKKIESSAFVLCLDDTKPVTLEEISHSCWVGDGRNRFFDKSLQFIVFDNGRAGFNGEVSLLLLLSLLNPFLYITLLTAITIKNICYYCLAFFYGWDANE